MSEGAKRIAAERERQMSVETWDEAHDDEHEDGELAAAAVCYAAPRPVYEKRDYGSEVRFVDPWPQDWDGWDKRPRDDEERLREPTREERIRMLEKAGALIAAEIDRLLRASPQATTPAPRCGVQIITPGHEGETLPACRNPMPCPIPEHNPAPSHDAKE
jgi:hypothetical protein